MRASANCAIFYVAARSPAQSELDKLFKIAIIRTVSQSAPRREADLTTNAVLLMAELLASRRLVNNKRN